MGKLQPINEQVRAQLDDGVVGRMWSFAACDADLPTYLRRFIPDRERAAVQIVNLTTPDPQIRCGCTFIAKWYVRVTVDVVTGA